jgi:hypothetical protein
MSVYWKSAAAGLALAALGGSVATAAEPFQQGPLRQICDRRGDCIVKFAAVPKKEEWVVGQVSCWWGMLTSGETKVVSVSLGSTNAKGQYTDAIFLGAPQMVSVGPTSASFALLADVQWVMAAGSSPAVRFSIESANQTVGFNSLCSITGTKP